MHYQIAPYEEAKLIRCTKGKIFDVVIDLRSKSNTFKQWFGIEISDENYKMLYVPEGFAHGFQTLEDNTEVFYQMSEMYMPDYVRGVRYNDEIFNIGWPITPTIISEKDRIYPSFKEQ
jgi:dTDP-4-dehydrorhamnose 3,5-epimerase